MKRIEIIANQAIEEEIIDLLTEIGYGESFTYLHPVFGRGEDKRREGSAVWPETNTQFIIYMTDPDGEKALEKIDALKKDFPREGIKRWSMSADDD